MTATASSYTTVDPHLAFVIDDDASVRSSIEAVLAQLRMKAASFQMAKEALASLDAGHHPAIIFLDVALLRSDAIDVLRGLGERHYGGVVQLMSGGRQALIEAVQRIGVRHGIRLAAPLHKPFEREAIMQALLASHPAGANAPTGREPTSEPSSAVNR